MPSTRPALLVVVMTLLVGAAGGPALAGAQEDLVTLTVTVETAAGDPVRDARVTARWDDGATSRTTASNGKVFIDVPAGADVQLDVRHADFTRNVPLRVEDAEAQEVTLTVYEKGSMTVSVADTGGAVSEASVVLRKGGVEAVNEETGPDGVVDSGTIEVGTYEVVVSKAGYFTEERTVDVTGDASLSVELERGTATLEVTVTDDHFDPARPLEEATVNVQGSGSVATQPTGVGRISVPVNAWATVEVTKDGYQTASESVFVGEGDTSLELSVTRTPAISVEVLNERVVIGERVALTVTDEYGEPVGGAVVLIDGEQVGSTDAGGEAVVTVDSAGELEVVVEKGDLQTSTTVTGIEEGQAATDAPPTATAAEPTTDDSPVPETISELPGFGVEVAVISIALAVLAARLRRR